MPSKGQVDGTVYVAEGGTRCLRDSSLFLGVLILIPLAKINSSASQHVDSGWHLNHLSVLTHLHNSLVLLSGAPPEVQLQCHHNNVYPHAQPKHGCMLCCAVSYACCAVLCPMHALLCCVLCMLCCAVSYACSADWSTAGRSSWALPSCTTHKLSCSQANVQQYRVSNARLLAHVVIDSGHFLQPAFHFSRVTCLLCL